MHTFIRYSWGHSALGQFLIAASPRGLVAVEFGEAREALLQALRQRFAGSQVEEDPAGLAASAATVVALIERPQPGGELPLDLQGSAFELRVWQALRAIPPGETRSYGQIAAQLGAPRLAREVGAACAANTLAVLVPCHRVLKQDGSLSGYRWGVRRKRALLQREAQA